MINEQKVMDILKNMNSGSIYYIKAMDINKLKNSDDEGSIIEDRLIDNKVSEDDINDLLNNYLIIWIEEFKTMYNEGEVVYKIDETKLIEIIYKFKFNKDIDIEKTEQPSLNTNIITKDPYITEITKELLDFIQNDEKLQSILTKNEYNIVGLMENGKLVFKLLNKNMEILTSINIPIDSNEVIRYMRFSLFKEQIKSIVSKGV